MKADYINYFGYGTNRDPEMMEAIIGRKPRGEEALLMRYERVIQTWEQIPETIKHILRNNWKDNEGFKTYSLRKNAQSRVDGMVWYITQQERELIAKWEMDNLWYTPITVKVRLNNGSILQAETQYIVDLKNELAIAEPNSPVHLSNKDRMLEVARNVRKSYLSK